MFIGGGVGRIGRVGGGRRGNAPAPGPTPTPTAFDTDATPDNMTGPWHADMLFVPQYGTPRIIIGYSNGDSPPKFCIQERALDGTLLDSRVLVVDGTRHPTRNIHYYMQVVEFDDGSIAVIKVPHGGNASAGGNAQLDFFYSATGRTANLVYATGGTGTNGNILSGADTINYTQVYRRPSDGARVVIFTNDNNTPAQSARALLMTTGATVPAALRRRIFNGNGTDQFYWISSQEPGNPDRVACFLNNHPTSATPKISLAWIDLNAGTVRKSVDTSATTEGTGTIYDTVAAQPNAMLTVDTAHEIYTPAGTDRMRRHDACRFGDYQARAVSFTEWASGASQNARSHRIVYCPPGLDRAVKANWYALNIGAINRAREVEGSGNSNTINQDIQFLAPRFGYAMEVLVSAYEAATGYRNEVWGITPAGSSPYSATPVLIGATPWAATPIPLRTLAVPGSGDVLAYVMNQSNWSGIYNYDPGAVQIVRRAGPANLTAPAFTASPAVGVSLATAIGTYTGIPTPGLSHAIESSADGNAPWTEISATLAYTPVSGDLGRPLRIKETADNGVGSPVVTYSATSAPVSAFNPSALGPFIDWRTAGITSAGTPPRASAWASYTVDGGLSASLAQATGGEQPEVVASGLRFDQTRGDDMTGSGALTTIMRGKSAILTVMPVERTATPAAATMVLGVSRPGSDTQGSWALIMGTDGAISASQRRATGDAASTTGTFTLVANTKYFVAILANYSTTTPTFRMRVYAADGTTVLATLSATPTTGAVSDGGTNNVVAIGRTIGASAQTCPCITQPPFVQTRASGAISDVHEAAIVALVAARP